jgi:formylglycine-generating enzyme required for sulfatase activity
MEDFEAGTPLPLEECLRRVREQADVLVVIIANRYGWVPSDDWPDLPQHQIGKSITWLECLEADAMKGIRVIPLVLGDVSGWPAGFFEEQHRLELDQFKRWIDLHFIAKRFTTNDAFRDELTRALDEWKKWWITDGATSSEEPDRYFAWITEQACRAFTPLGIHGDWEDVCIPLYALRSGKPAALESFLSSPRLIVAGEPGSGKSTFLFKYGRDLADAVASQANGRFPIVLPAAEFWNHVTAYSSRREPGSPVSAHSPRWISHFLATASAEHAWGLSIDFFERLLIAGRCTILLDGLDQSEPRRVALLLDEASRAYPGCHIVATSRPWAVIDPPEFSRFTRVDIAPLDRRGIRSFLLNRARASEERPDEAQRRANRLYRAIARSEPVRRLARNPLVLHTIAAGCREPAALPSNRLRLYESIIGRLLDADAGDDSLEVVQQLAWRMQAGPTPRTEVTKRWAGEQVYTLLPQRSVGAAVKLLEKIAARTGLLSGDHDRFRFWHPTLQEFLAARWLAYRPDRIDILVREIGDRIAAESWRPILLFLSRILIEEPADFEAFAAHLLHQSEITISTEVRALYAGALAALDRELEAFPVALRDRHIDLLKSFQELFRSGNVGEIDLAARLELARALGSAGTIGKELSWVPIPPGEFWMGAQAVDACLPRYDPDAHPAEAPVRRVALTAYCISRYPVTVAQYAEFVRERGYDYPEFWTAGGFGNASLPLRWHEQAEYDNHPVTGVSWYEAAAFCAWSRSSLPSEAEWERAAAGPEGRRFPWGASLPDHHHANFGRRFGGVTPVGLFPDRTSGEGVHDLAGNVWEWSLDPYAPHGDAYRVLRGGCHQNGWRFLRTSERIHAAPGQRYVNFGSIGFRCVRREG